jgi:hypothetical protein
MGKRDAYHGIPMLYPSGSGRGPFFAGYLAGYNS